MSLQFTFEFSYPNSDVRDVGSMFVYRFLQDEERWLSILSAMECRIREIRVESRLVRVPYTSSMRFCVHVDVDLPEAMGIFYPSLDANIRTQILLPLGQELDRAGCYDCRIEQKR